MNFSYLRTTAAAAVLIGIGFAPALAQRQPTPEQRIGRLEKQVRQIQGRVFPKGQPAATAGTDEEPAATQSAVTTLDQRLDSLERQMADILRQAEENGHRLSVIEADAAKAREDQDQRLRALETAAQAAQTAATVPAATDVSTTSPEPSTPLVSKPKVETTSTLPKPVAGTAGTSDPGEDAYSEGFRLWQNKKYDQAIASLRAFTAAFPKHRRVSYANNLTGRALLDKGQPRAAAEALLANYRSNPKGERAQDSLYYLGQALMALGQPGQACKAYAELEDVYGASMRAEVKAMLPKAKSNAGCK
jgi:TolA-binding protein